MDLKQAKALARKRLGDKRYHHTLNVEKMAVKLAGHYGADPDQAALAALLHDTAKEMPTAEQLALLRAHPDLAGDTENRPTPSGTGCARPSWPGPSGASPTRPSFRRWPATRRASRG